MSKLTPREKQVCEIIHKQPGLTANGIGAQVGISPNTVKVYLQRVYRKLEVGSRPELVANLCRNNSNPSG